MLSLKLGLLVFEISVIRGPNAPSLPFITASFFLFHRTCCKKCIRRSIDQLNDHGGFAVGVNIVLNQKKKNIYIYKFNHEYKISMG